MIFIRESASKTRSPDFFWIRMRDLLSHSFLSFRDSGRLLERLDLALSVGRGGSWVGRPQRDKQRLGSKQEHISGYSGTLTV